MAWTLKETKMKRADSRARTEKFVCETVHSETSDSVRARLSPYAPASWHDWRVQGGVLGLSRNLRVRRSQEPRGTRAWLSPRDSLPVGRVRQTGTLLGQVRFSTYAYEGEHKGARHHAMRIYERVYACVTYILPEYVRRRMCGYVSKVERTNSSWV